VDTPRGTHASAPVPNSAKHNDAAKRSTIDTLKKEIKETFAPQLKPGADTVSSSSRHQEPYRDYQNEMAKKYPDDFSLGARGFPEQPPQAQKSALEKVRDFVLRRKDE